MEKLRETDNACILLKKNKRLQEKKELFRKEVYAVFFSYICGSLVFLKASYFGYKRSSHEDLLFSFPVEALDFVKLGKIECFEYPLPHQPS